MGRVLLVLRWTADLLGLDGDLMEPDGGRPLSAVSSLLDDSFSHTRWCRLGP